MGFIEEIIEFFRKPPAMTITISRNPGNLTHQGCNGTITLAIFPSRKSTVTCSKCNAQAEFDSIYATVSFRFTKEDGATRKIPISRYRDTPVKGHLHIIAAPVH